jgi:O-antigen/teichoic acid export membrane protein
MNDIKWFRKVKVRYSRELLVVLGVNGLLFFLNFATLKLLTGFIPPSEFGVYSLATTLLAFLSLVLVSPLNQYSNRFASGAGLQFLNTLLLIFVKISLIVGLIGAAGVVGFQLNIDERIGPQFLMVLFFGFLFSAIIAIIATVINSKRKRIAGGVVSISDAILRFFSLVLVVKYFDRDAYAIFCGIAISNILSSIFAYFVMSRVAREEPSGANELALSFTFLLRYSSPFVLTGLLSSFILYSDRWIVNLLLDSTAVAYYASATTISFSILAIFFGVGNQYFLPYIFSSANDSLPGAARRASLLLKRYIGFSSVVYVVAICIGWGGGGVIYSFMFPENYLPYKVLLPLSIAGYSLYFLGELFCVYGQIYSVTKIYWWCKIPAIFVLFSFTPLLFNKFGIVGISYGFILASIAYLLSVIYSNRRILNEN